MIIPTACKAGTTVCRGCASSPATRSARPRPREHSPIVARIPDLHSEPLGTANRFKATPACITGTAACITGGITTCGDPVARFNNGTVIPVQRFHRHPEVRALARLEGWCSARCVRPSFEARLRLAPQDDVYVFGRREAVLTVDAILAGTCRSLHSALSIFQKIGVAGPPSRPVSDFRHALGWRNCPSGMTST
jgi:hypothetical protein